MLAWISLDPLQPRVSEDSSPVRYKQDFGDRLLFWGGIDVQQTLPLGTPEEVRAEVGVRIGEMAWRRLYSQFVASFAT